MRKKIFTAVICMLLSVPFLGCIMIDSGAHGMFNDFEDYRVLFSMDGFVYSGELLDEKIPLPVIIKNKQELDAYVKKVTSRLVSEFVDSADKNGLMDSIEREIEEFYSVFNTDFFEQNKLIIALIDRGSGVLSFELGGLKIENSTLRVTINRHSPMIQTMDYRLHSMFLAVNKNHFNFDGIAIDIVESGPFLAQIN